MANISRIPVENITSISNTNVASISQIFGIPTRDIPGWSGNGPSCTTLSLSPGNDPDEACYSGRYLPFEFDSSTGILYLEGQCGGTLADSMFYSDQNTNEVYYFDGASYQFVGNCKG
jgi:hypothetical protein